MPRANREQRERTDTSQLLEQWSRTPEQSWYAGMRPGSLFGMTPGARAEATSLAERTLRQVWDAFGPLLTAFQTAIAHL